MIKTPEELKLQGFGSFETLDSKLRHGTSLKFADVRHHLRKVSKKILYKKIKADPRSAFHFSY